MPTFDPARTETTLFAAFRAAARRHGEWTPILADATGTVMTYRDLTLAALVLGRRLTARAPSGAAVGLLLPNVAGLVAAILGLNAMGRASALLNFTAGLRNLEAAIATAPVGLVVTSRRFLETAKLEDTVAALAALTIEGGRKVEIVYLEDVRRAIGWRDKALALLSLAIAARMPARHGMTPASLAAILFTSGTEGVPKGVALTNANLVANALQIEAHAASFLSPADTIVNPLPMFHSFGLTAGTLMGLLSGIRVVLYPSPLHYKQVPKLVAAHKATVLFATDTFLQGYARAAAPGDFATLRYAIAGAERVKPQTREMWRQGGAILLEGYGVTECSPVIACNTPEAMREGTVGRPLQGIETRLIPVEGIAEGGRLAVRGRNVMAGYIHRARPGIIEPPEDGWYDTGDIVAIDDGYISIRGRAKRFAKIGGEMVSLAAVEALAVGLWPDGTHVAVTLPDPRKGESLVLVTDRADADKDQLMAFARAEGTPELWVPRAILVVAQVPILGSGKIDYPGVTALAAKTRPLL